MSRWGCAVVTAHGLAEAREALERLRRAGRRHRRLPSRSGRRRRSDPGLARRSRPRRSGDPGDRRPEPRSARRRGPGGRHHLEQAAEAGPPAGAADPLRRDARGGGVGARARSRRSCSAPSPKTHEVLSFNSATAIVPFQMLRRQILMILSKARPVLAPSARPTLRSVAASVLNSQSRHRPFGKEMSTFPNGALRQSEGRPICSGRLARLNNQQYDVYILQSLGLAASGSMGDHPKTVFSLKAAFPL